MAIRNSILFCIWHMRYSLISYENGEQKFISNIFLDSQAFVQSPTVLNTILSTSLIGRGVANRIQSSQCDGVAQTISNCLRTTPEEEAQLADGIKEARVSLSVGRQNKTTSYHYNTEGFIDMGRCLAHMSILNTSV